LRFNSLYSPLRPLPISSHKPHSVGWSFLVPCELPSDSFAVSFFGTSLALPQMWSFAGRLRLCVQPIAGLIGPARPGAPPPVGSSVVRCSVSVSAGDIRSLSARAARSGGGLTAVRVCCTDTVRLRVPALQRASLSSARLFSVSAAAEGPVERSIREALSAAFSPLHLEVRNESGGHSVPKGSETHFKVIVVSSAFDGASLVDRHRKVNRVLVPPSPVTCTGTH
jgi:stress-induced morphogen